jgi:cytochrome b involved in lipid metabolism
LKTTIEINPESRNVQLTFNWDDAGGKSASAGGRGGSQVSSSAAAQSAPPQQTPNQAGPNGPGAGKAPPEKVSLKAYTLEEVAKHKTKDDVWVVVNGEVLDVTKFKASVIQVYRFITVTWSFSLRPYVYFLDSDHPGGEKAIMLYAGRDATEEFNSKLSDDIKVSYSFLPSQSALTHAFPPSVLHDPKVVKKYAPDSIIGTLKE